MREPGVAIWAIGLLFKVASDALAVLEVCDRSASLVVLLNSVSPWLAGYSIGGFLCASLAAMLLIATGTRRLCTRSVCTVLCAAGNAILLYSLLTSQLRHVDVHGTDPFMVFGVCLWGIVAVLATLATTVREIRFRRTRHRRTLCLRCGYSLRGLREARCPECGAPFPKSQLSLLVPADPAVCCGRRRHQDDDD